VREVARPFEVLWPGGSGCQSRSLGGVASTLVIGIIATLAVGAKALAKYVAHKPPGYGGLLMRGVEFGAAGLMFAFGILLLTRYMVSERVFGF